MSTATFKFSDAERDMLRANAQRLQFAKLAEALRIYCVGMDMYNAIDDFVTSMRWLAGMPDYLETYTFEHVIEGLGGGA
jgi:hypothetical protein